MAWEGYFEYAGSEVINVARTEAYARDARWFRPQFENESLPLILGDGGYRSPLMDDAPWTDPDIEESYDFLGLYPLSVEGLENSTRTSTVVESLGDGGLPGRVRHGTKAVVFNCLILATSEAGADYGMMWLRRILLGGPCGPDVTSSCFGASLCYLSSAPEYEQPTDSFFERLDGGDPESGGYFMLGGGPSTVTPYLTSPVNPSTWAAACLARHMRSISRVTFNNGPTITSKRQMTDGASVWQVTFTAVAGNPYEFGSEVQVIQGFLDPEVEVPWAGGYEPDGASLDTLGHTVTEPDCSEPAQSPVVDPLHPAIIPPPGPPSVPLGNFTPPTSWHRRQFTVPKQYVPLWGEVVPKLNLHARDGDVRNVRLRFYSDPFNVGDISDDPCAYCGDIIVSYVPVDHTLVFDAAEEQVYVTAAGGGRQRADSLVFKSDGTPFDWPVLTCGFGYIVTLDMPKQQAPPVVDLSLFARTT